MRSCIRLISIAAVSSVLVFPTAQVAASNPIPVVVTDIQLLKDNHRLRFTLRNASSDRIVAWSLQFDFKYPDGYVSRKGRAVHCHTTAVEAAIVDCEIGPGEQRDQEIRGIRAWAADPPEVSATVESVVFESDDRTTLKSVGNRELLEEMADDWATTQRAWSQILAILEKSRELKDPSALRDAYDRLGREGPLHPETDRVRSEMAKQLAERSQGLKEGPNDLELWIVKARQQATHRPHVER
jgi:hypothetical protein